MNSKLNWLFKHNRENNNEYQNYIFLGEYLGVYNPTHHKANSEGYVYIHQLQAEKMLGRLLNAEECVHHIDEDKFNNSLDNLMVFKTVGDHTAFHMGRDIELVGDVFVAKRACITIRQNNSSAKYELCPCCKINYKAYGAQHCKICHDKYFRRRKVNNLPTKQELITLMHQYSMTQIGKIYNVSDNAVRKWCKKYDLPYKRKDIVLLEY